MIHYFFQFKTSFIKTVECFHPKGLQFNQAAETSAEGEGVRCSGGGGGIEGLLKKTNFRPQHHARLLENQKLPVNSQITIHTLHHDLIERYGLQSGIYASRSTTRHN